MTKKILYYAAIDLNMKNACPLHVLGIINGFAAEGHDVTAILPQPRSKVDHSFYLKSPSVKYIFHRSIIRRPRFLGAIFSLPKIIKQLKTKPDFFYLRMSLLSFVPLLIAKIYGVKTISEHNGWMQTELEMLGVPKFIAIICRMIQVLDSRLATVTLSVTDGIKNQLQQCGAKDNFIVVGNGTDIDLFTPADRQKMLKRFGLDEQYFYVGFIGALTKWQGLDLALHGFAQAASRHANLRMIIAGEGPERENIEDLVRKFGLNDKVTLMGGVSIGEAPNVINCFDIALSNSTAKLNNKAGVSKLKTRDYSACGRVIIASRVPGNVELEKEKILLCHDVDDAEDLADKIASLVQDEKLCKDLMTKSRDFAEKNFSWQGKCRQILKRIK